MPPTGRRWGVLSGDAVGRRPCLCESRAPVCLRAVPRVGSIRLRKKGNGRLQAMLAEGWSHVAVTFVDLPDDRANALAIMLNRSPHLRNWNDEALKEIMAKL